MLSYHISGEESRGVTPWQVVPLRPSQVSPCEVGSRPVPGGGSRLALETARTQRVAGGCPPPPLVYGPLVGTRSFWRLWHIVLVEGLLRYPCTCPDLGRFFVWGCTTQRLPLGGKLSPKVTDEGATDLPNGAEEKFRWGDRR